MKIPVEFVGEFVMLHLARPVYMAEYAGHAKMGDTERLVARPIVRRGGTAEAPEAIPVLSDVIMSALVRSVGEDSVTVSLFDPSEADPRTGNEIALTLDEKLVMACMRMVGFEVAVPVAVRQQRAEAPKSKLLI